MPFIPMPASRDEWLELRQGYVGASAVAALFGCQADYQLSHYALWHVKAGTAPEPDVGGPRVAWGLKLEEVIATAYGETARSMVQRGRFAISDTCRLAASLDFEVEGDPEGPGVLETKNVDWLIHRRSWDDGEPPPHILLQLQAQLLATGYQWGAVAALVGGNDLKVYRYGPHDDIQAQIKERVDAFWKSIADNRPPPADGSDGAAHVLKHLYPHPRDIAANLSGSNEWPVAAAAFLAAQAAKKTAERDYDNAKARVAELLGNHLRGYGGGFSVSIAVTPEKPPRPPEPGEMISGRKEARRYTIRKEAA